MSLETIFGIRPSDRAARLRAIALERERIANHLGDLGALGNDAGLAFGLSQFMRLKEDCLRLNKEVFGHRFMMDFLCPGGVQHDVAPESLLLIFNQVADLEREVRTLQDIYDDHAGLQDRFLTTGIVSNEVAVKLGVTGLAGRASGILHDVRIDAPCAPYDHLAVRLVSREAGDVSARVDVRFDEIYEAIRLIRLMIADIPEGAFRSELPTLERGGSGAGWIEGWRGGIFTALELGEHGEISRCHVHDPSWQNWPALEYAVIGDIVPDFPLINKSFNLTYSGHDR